MKKPLLFIFSLILFAACSSEVGEKSGDTFSKENDLKEEVAEDAVATDGHSSRDAVDWEGTYSGITPCADCEGIETTITLKRDGKYSRRLVYQGKSKTPLMSMGKYEWNEAGSVVTLLSPAGEDQMYKVGENRLIHLDKQGKMISGDLADKYVLEKNFADPAVEGVRWEMVELKGEPFEKADGLEVPHIIFDSVEGSFSGSGSCNSFFGTYRLMEGNKIEVGRQIGITQKACANMDLEQEFLDLLKKADIYVATDSELTLKSTKAGELLAFKKSQATS